ncbi:MAG: CopD family protein [Acidobacteria bacterium]|nr:CopD family protein [Acidobacteriota bacterium]
MNAVATEAATKAILYAALLPTVGASAAFLFVAARLRPQAPASVESSIRRVGLIAASGVVVALALRAWAQADATFGLADSFSPESLHTILTSRWGLRWDWQLLAAVACTIAYAGSGGGRRVAWFAAAASGVALCVALTLTGHASGDPWRMTVHAMHLTGGSLWLGTLTTLALVTPSIDAESRVALFRAFSPVALAGAGLAAAAGATTAWMYLGAVDQIWQTPYGRTLAIKVILVACVAVCGLVNWRRADAGAGQGRVVALELLFAAAVIVSTAVLTELEHP